MLLLPCYCKTSLNFHSIEKKGKKKKRVRRERQSDRVPQISLYEPKDKFTSSIIFI
jgi:hypothetical protein